MRLTQHFTLEEFTRSAMASRAGIENKPSEEQIQNLHALAQELENIRERVGLPIVVTSGFRCKLLNELIPGSAPNSAHCEGLAADFHVPGVPHIELAQMILHWPVKFDQLIYEYKSWVHLSVAPPLRRLVLTKNAGESYKKGLVA